MTDTIPRAVYNLIPLFVIIPLAGAFITSLVAKKVKWVADMLANLVSFVLLIASVASVLAVNTYGVLVYQVGIWKPPLGISMVLDPLAAFMLLTVNLVVFLITIYSINYMEKYTAKWNFYTLFLLLVAGMNGVIITGDIFNLFVFLEIASVASYALVAYGTDAEELEASFKYLVMSSVGSFFVLLGIALMYSYTSTLNMADMAIVLAEKGLGRVTYFSAVLFLMGFGLKAALVPFHAWLPDAHPAAPAPISAMLSGVIIKALGVYALIRILYNVIGLPPVFSNVLMFLGALSMIVGVFLAIGQFDLKRLLAYHSISQIGYVVLGIGLGTPLGILGGLFHLFNHSVFKSLLFLNAGAVEYAAGTRDLNSMGGLNKKMPVTGATSLFASLAIAGIPPFNGFFSKLIIIFAAVEAGRMGYALLAVIASILTLASFMKVQKFAFFGKLKESLSDIKEVPFFMKSAMISLALICLFGGLLLMPGIFGRFIKPAAETLHSGNAYSITVMEGIEE
ncbi:MAG: NADH/ubiquinone/plastoquinone (complex I) [Candidatus Omnitrophica bacterium]|nr:NADH/ubiquinone/plastoquinone (complex I) [Candidatus Omnitrophota bacterium]MBU4487511.1 NADH/ubiquinone/plastoquinone (complex I) [Candidatus Omnitrophota bacterium]MCG2704901.1 NADH/ubiquinone/plastoquinone (complex I) [Candidatus Omnitrophota bacterium]